MFNLKGEAVMKYAICLIVLLAGCVSAEERLAQYHYRCAAYGFQPGTGDFAVCMQNLDMQRRAHADAAMREGAFMLGTQRR